MQNKMISLAVILLTSAAYTVFPAIAQTPVKTAKPAPVVQTAKTAPAKTAQTKPAQVKSAVQPVKTATAKPAAEPAKTIPQVHPTSAAVKTPAVSPKDVQVENKRRMEEELKNTTISGKSIVDFPNRPSLGSLELAPLPGINDVAINGPAPMEASVSGKDLPSEQLLGRITPEVFQEMADLERGNTFLKLQLEKEKLKNDLEKLKATYRQQRLDEISKREDVVRSRIQWWQEQEKLRLAIAKKQAEEDALARKIAEQEANREKIREEALKRLAAAPKGPLQNQGNRNVKPTIVTQQTMEELYTLDSVRGIGTNLSAKIKSKSDGSVITIKKDDILPTGHVVKEIQKDVVTVAFGNRIDQLAFRPANK